MDSLFIVLTQLSHLWFVPLLLLAAAVVRSPWFKGAWGEFWVKHMLRKLPQETYWCLDNITLETEEGSTQIDHVVLSIYGIFVIETKNMRGWIFGSAKQPYWTQKLYRRSYRFQNPLHQNYKHIKTLAACLGISEESLKSLVIFIGDSRFKTTMPENVTFAAEGRDYILQFQQPLFSEEQVQSWVEQIQQGRLSPGWKTHRQHVAHVQELVAKKQLVQQEASVSPQCPKCGSTMLQRQRRQPVSVTFWGCAHYPRCRGTLPMREAG